MPITFNHNDMSVSTVRILHRLCVLLCFTVSDPTRKCPMLDSYMGHAGAIGGVYVICIWGVTQMGCRIGSGALCALGFKYACTSVWKEFQDLSFNKSAV